MMNLEIIYLFIRKNIANFAFKSSLFILFSSLTALILLSIYYILYEFFNIRLKPSGLWITLPLIVGIYIAGKSTNFIQYFKNRKKSPEPTKENKMEKFNIEEASKDYKQLVLDNKISELLGKIETNSNDEILKIIAFKSADMHDKARRLIDFLRAEIDIRQINSNNKLNTSICYATWIIAISTFLSLLSKIF